MQFYKFILQTSDASIITRLGRDRIMTAISTPMLGEPRFAYGFHANVEATSPDDAANTVRSWFADEGLPEGISALFKKASPYLETKSHPLTPKNGQVATFMNAVAGREAEFEHWHTTKHLVDALASPGWMGAERFHLVEGGKSVGDGGIIPWRYLVLYDLSSADLPGVVDHAFSKVGTPEMPISDAATADNLLSTVFRIADG